MKTTKKACKNAGLVTHTSLSGFRSQPVMGSGPYSSLQDGKVPQQVDLSIFLTQPDWTD